MWAGFLNAKPEVAQVEALMADLERRLGTVLAGVSKADRHALVLRMALRRHRWLRQEAAGAAATAAPRDDTPPTRHPGS